MFGKVLSVFLIAASLGACDVYRELTVAETPTELPELVVEGASPDDILLVNGITIGRAVRFRDANRALHVPVGEHLVQIQRGQDIVLTETLDFPAGSVHRVTAPGEFSEQEAAGKT